MQNHNTEIELKFLVGRHLPFKQLRAEFVEQVSAFGFVITRQRRQRLTDVYVDSLSSNLERAAWTLRCRYTDTDSVCVTLKSIADANATFYRTEHEEVLPRGKVHLDEQLVIPGNSKIVQLMHKYDLPTQGLLPVSKQTNKRKNYTITHPAEPNTEIQWSVDKVRAENSQGLHTLERYIEFEFELLSGSEKLLQHLKLIAQRRDGLYAARMGKFRRARYAHNPRSSHLKALRQTQVRHQDPFNFKTRLKHLIQYEPFAYEALHPEGVHQMRVSTRKLRASLSLLHEQVPAALATRLESELKTLTSRLGKVRDLDVHRDQLGALLQRDEWQNYLEHLNASTHKQQLRLRRTLDSSFSDIVSELDIFTITDFTSTQASHFATETSAEIIQQIHTTIQGISATADAKRLHKLRIELKKLHYKLTTYADQEEQVLQWLKHIKGLLILLGEFQDTEMAQLKIKKYLRNKPKSEKRHFKSFIHTQKHLAAKHRAVLVTACSNLANLEPTTR